MRIVSEFLLVHFQCFSCPRRTFSQVKTLSPRDRTVKTIFKFALVIAIVSNSYAGERQTDLRLTLPPRIYAVEGLELSVYFDNLVLAQTREDYHFQIESDLGVKEVNRWFVIPAESDVGKHTIKVSVFSKKNEKLAEESSQLIVVPATAGDEISKTIRLLIIGDSLTHASRYPNRIAKLLAAPGNPEFKFMGTHQPGSADENVFHEGYGGWTWERFTTKYEPNPDGTYRKRSSPFVFFSKSGESGLNIERYFEEHFGGNRPDYVVILLGINDCFSAPPNDLDGMNKRIDQMFEHAQTLLIELHKAAPQARVGFCITTPPNSRQTAFEANYQDRYTRWGWKQIQHRLVEREIEFVQSLMNPKISLVPTQLDIDPVAGYPDNNAVHPNHTGYDQIGTSIYAWLKYQFMSEKR